MFDIQSVYEATSIQDAITALSTNPKAIVIAGGSDVLIKIREGKLAGAQLVSIHDIKALSGVSLEQNGTIRIGPTTTFAQLTANPIIQRQIPTLGEAVDQAGGPQLRNVGTIGGNVCNGVTSADSASTLLTLNAVLEISGPDSMRQIPLEQFYKGPGKVDLAHGELLTAILIHKSEYEGFGGHYIKYAMRKAMDIATIGCAVHVRLNAQKQSIEQLRLAFGVAAPVPIRCHKTEVAAQGQEIAPQLYQLVAQTALSEVTPRTSWRATKEFRQQLILELSQRALKEAIHKAGGAL